MRYTTCIHLCTSQMMRKKILISNMTVTSPLKEDWRLQIVGIRLYICYDARPVLTRGCGLAYIAVEPPQNRVKRK